MSTAFDLLRRIVVLDESELLSADTPEAHTEMQDILKMAKELLEQQRKYNC